MNYFGIFQLYQIRNCYTTAIKHPVSTPQTLAEVEERMFREAMDRGLADLSAQLQEMADAMPAEGSDGRRLRRTRRIGMEIDTSLGKAKIAVLCGQCRSTGGWEAPFRDRLFRGERGAVSPALERRIVTTVCESGSFEKAAKGGGAWWCGLSDDKAMATVRRVPPTSPFSAASRGRAASRASSSITRTIPASHSSCGGLATRTTPRHVRSRVGRRVSLPR